MLKELYEYAISKKLCDDINFQKLKVKNIVNLNMDSEFICVTESDKEWYVPVLCVRSSNTKSNFLIDNKKYIYGYDIKTDKAKLCQNDFIQNLKKCIDITDNKYIKVIYNYLINNPEIDSSLSDDKNTNWISFNVIEDNIDHFVFDMEDPLNIEIKNYWSNINSTTSGVNKCSITGTSFNYNKDDLVKKVKFPGFEAGISLLCYNFDSVNSYGFNDSENAMISPFVSRNIVEAINDMCKRDSNHSIRLKQTSDDSSVLLYWNKHNLSDDNDFEINFQNILLESDLNKLHDIEYKIKSGNKINIKNDLPFYMLFLNGKQGRIMVKNFIDTTTENIIKNMKQYFEDIEFETLFGLHSEKSEKYVKPNITNLFTSFDSSSKLSTQIQVPSKYVNEFVHCALLNKKFPNYIFKFALNRLIRNNSITNKQFVHKVRINNLLKLLKCCLNRNYNRKIKSTMDYENTSKGYLLGRLCACIEKMQLIYDPTQSKHTIIEVKFRKLLDNFNMVFPNIDMKYSSVYLPKCKSDERCGIAIYIDKIYQSIISQIDAKELKTKFNQFDKVDFIFGYHHQQSDFYKTKEKENKNEEL